MCPTPLDPAILKQVCRLDPLALECFIIRIEASFFHSSNVLYTGPAHSAWLLLYDILPATASVLAVPAFAACPWPYSGSHLPMTD